MGGIYRGAEGGFVKARRVDADNFFFKYTYLRTLLNKKDDVRILMNSENLDIFAITES